MHPFISKTFGGLSRPYYFRHFIFGLVFFGLALLMFSNMATRVPVVTILLPVLNTILYPYSRFVYEGVVGFVIGQNMFILPAVLMLLCKFVTMATCWAGAVFI